MFATVQFRIFFSKNLEIKISKVKFYLLFCMGMNLSLSHELKNIDLGCMRTEF